MGSNTHFNFIRSFIVKNNIWLTLFGMRWVGKTTVRNLLAHLLLNWLYDNQVTVYSSLSIILETNSTLPVSLKIWRPSKVFDFQIANSWDRPNSRSKFKICFSARFKSIGWAKGLIFWNQTLPFSQSDDVIKAQTYPWHFCPTPLTK